MQSVFASSSPTTAFAQPAIIPGQYFGAVIPSGNLASERMAVCAVPPSRELVGKPPEKRWRQGWEQRSHFWIDRMRKASYKYAGLCIFYTGFCLMRGDIVAGNGTDPELGTRKRFRQGQILKLISCVKISSNDYVVRRREHVQLWVDMWTI